MTDIPSNSNERGWYPLPRDFFDDRCIRKPYCEGLAWLWLQLEALYQPRTIMVRSGPRQQSIALQPGQLSHSLRYMAKAWGWTSKNRVKTFLVWRERHGKIRTSTGTPQLVITILDFERFLNETKKTGTPLGTSQGRHRDKEKEGNKETKDRDAPSNQESRESESPTESVQAESPNGQPTKYGFEGRVIRLSKRHYEQWRVGYSYLDLPAELIARDAYLATRPPEEQQRWFTSTSQHFNNRNAAAKADADARTKAEKDDPVVWRYLVGRDGRPLEGSPGFDTADDAGAWLEQNNPNDGKPYGVFRRQVSGPNQQSGII